MIWVGGPEAWIGAMGVRYNEWLLKVQGGVMLFYVQIKAGSNASGLNANIPNSCKPLIAVHNFNHGVQSAKALSLAKHSR